MTTFERLLTASLTPLPPHVFPIRSFLHDLFTRFDELVARFHVNKIETVGCVVQGCGSVWVFLVSSFFP